MRGTSRQVVVSVAVALVCLSVIGPVLAASGQSTGGPSTTHEGVEQPAEPATLAGDGVAAQQAPPEAFQSAVDPDVVVLRAAVREDGTAEWTVEFRVRLTDENETAAFESVQSDVESDPDSFTSQFATGMERTVASAANRTGREMALQNVTVSASNEQLPQEYGVLTYRFTWTNFARTGGERLRIGDSLSGFFLDSESSLVVTWPEGYEEQSVLPDPDGTGNNSVTWHGSADFGPNEPRIVLAPSSSGLPTTALVAAVLVGIVAVAAGGWLYRSRTADEAATSATSGTGEDTAGGAGGAAAGAVAAEDDGTVDEGDSTDDPPEALLSNEERVIGLLEDNGGRIKQQQIASEFDWTDAKTSQVVGNLRDDDAVETFRIGRENVVALPEESDL